MAPSRAAGALTVGALTTPSRVTRVAAEKADTLPAASVWRTRKPKLPSVLAGTLLDRRQWPCASANTVLSMVTPSRERSTRAQASAVPDQLRVFRAVMRSLLESPVSLAASRRGAARVATCVSTTMLASAELPRVCPWSSRARASRLCGPSLRALTRPRRQLPLASARVLPKRVLPAHTCTVALAGALLPVKTGRAWFVRPSARVPVSLAALSMGADSCVAETVRVNAVAALRLPARSTCSAVRLRRPALRGPARLSCQLPSAATVVLPSSTPFSSTRRVAPASPVPLSEKLGAWGLASALTTGACTVVSKFKTCAGLLPLVLPATSVWLAVKV